MILFIKHSKNDKIIELEKRSMVAQEAGVGLAQGRPLW